MFSPLPEVYRRNRRIHGTTSENIVRIWSFKTLDESRSRTDPWSVRTICKRTYAGREKVPEMAPDNTTRLDQQGVSRLPDCAQCMLSDEQLLRVSSAQLRGCNCSELTRPEGLIDACFARDSCSCACYKWIRASLRCPPAVIEASPR
jgi:hypothetical protein